MKIFNRVIPATVLALIVIAGLGSAALVGYISNTVTADVTVESPMLVGVSLGYPSWEGDSYPELSHDLVDWVTTGTLEIPVMKGGESVTLYTMSANLADATITAHEEIRISNPDGVTCEDFESITSRFDSIYGDLGYGGLHTDVGGATTDCHNVVGSSGKQIEIWSADDTSTWSAETDVAQWTITFQDNALGTYTFTYQVIPLTT